MSIKDKIRTYRIRNFIEKNRDLNFREDQLNILYTINSEDFLPKLNKMSKEEKEYVLEPLKYVINKDRELYNMHEIDPTQINKIIEEQLMIMKQKDFDLSSAPNLMKLYIACGGDRKKILYSHLLVMYLNDCPNALSYINVFTNICIIWKEIFSINNLGYSDSKKLQYISPSILFQLAKYGCETEEEPRKESILHILCNINEEEQEKINNIDPLSFHQLLEFIFKKERTSTYDLKLLMTTITGYNDCSNIRYNVDNKKLEVLEKLPPYIFDYLEKDIEENLDIINDLYDHEQVTEEIVKIDEISRNEVIRILESNSFSQLSPKSKTIILQKLRINDATEDEQFLMYKKGVEFLIGIEEEEGFLEELPETYIIPTLDFICKLDHNHTPDDQLQILEQKFKALNRIKSELSTDEKHINLFNKYIEFLNHGLGEKKPSDQVKQLQSRSAYFENEYFESLVENLEQSSNQKEILKLLYSNKTPEEMEQYYHFVNFAFIYREKILKKIVKKLRNTQSAENAKKIIEYIRTEQFIQSSPKMQRELLKSELHLGDKKKIEINGITIDIADYHYVRRKIENNDGKMTFINPETGIKVKIKTKKKKNRKNS